MTERYSVAKIDKLVKFIQREKVCGGCQEKSLGKRSLGVPVSVTVYEQSTRLDDSTDTVKAVA